MSKKPLRSRHRIPTLTVVTSDPIDERYQQEIDRSTARLEKAYRKAQSALEAAQRRAAKAREALERQRHNRSLKREHDRLVSLVEERMRELREIERLMMPDTYLTRDSRSRRNAARHETGSGLLSTAGHVESEVAE